MLTADRRISTGDRYLLRDLVGFGGMDFPCWVVMGKVRISCGRMDFCLCETVLFCYANSFYYLFCISLLCILCV